MPTGIPRSGIYKKRIAHVVISCTVCGLKKQYQPCQARQRTGKFCGKKCEALGKYLLTEREFVICNGCGDPFEKIKRLIKKRNFCTKSCKRTGRKPVLKSYQPKIVRLPFDMKVWRNANRSSINERSREYSNKNPEKRLETQRKYREKNKFKIAIKSQLRRAAMRGLNAASPSEVEEKFNRADGHCVYCGRKSKLTVDHVIPLSSAGDHSEQNLVPCCKSCNSSKNKSELSEWLDRSYGIVGLGRAVMFLEGKAIHKELLA